MPSNIARMLPVSAAIWMVEQRSSQNLLAHLMHSSFTRLLASLRAARVPVVGFLWCSSSRSRLASISGCRVTMFASNQSWLLVFVTPNACVAAARVVSLMCSQHSLAPRLEQSFSLLLSRSLNFEALSGMEVAAALMRTLEWPTSYLCI